MPGMSDFTFEFDMATTSTPRTASPSYTALKSYVMAGEGMTFSRGRGSEQESTAQPGRGAVTLRNTDQRFTWGNGSSPYAPIQLRRPCRFRVTYSATTYDRWYGFVDEWANDRVETTGVARLSMSDRVARAATTKLPALYDAEVLYDAPVAYYPLSDGGAPAGDLAGGAVGPMGLYTTGSGSPVTFGSGFQSGPDNRTQVAFTTSASPGVNYTRLVTARAITQGTAFTLECVTYFASPAPTAQQQILGMDTLGLFIQENTGRLFFYDFASGAFPTILAGAYQGSQQHIAVVGSVSGGTLTWTLYVGGVAAGTYSYSSSFIGGGGPESIFISGYFGFDGRISNVAAFPSALSAGRIQQHADVARSWAGETTLDRFARLCRIGGAVSTATTGTTAVTMSGQPTAERSLLSLLSDLATTEGGAIYADKAGALALSTAASRYNTAVGLTLDASKAGQVLAGTIDLRTDPDNILNDVTTVQYGGSEQRVFDATSVTAYDTHDETVTLYHDISAMSLNWAQWRVASYKDPRPRCESVTVDVVAYANSGGNVANLLNADVGTKLRLSNLPTDVYSTSTLDLFIEGVRDEVTKDTYRITFTTSPVALEDTVWVLGTSLLGVGTVLGY